MSNNSEIYKSEIIRMVDKMSNETMLMKIYSFVKVFFESK
jgi:hypothetical protein